MAYKKYTVSVGADFGVSNIYALEKIAKNFWLTFTSNEQKSWLDNRISKLDNTGEDTFLAFIIGKYTNTNPRHVHGPLGDISIQDDSKKLFRDRKLIGLTVS